MMVLHSMPVCDAIGTVMPAQRYRDWSRVRWHHVAVIVHDYVLVLYNQYHFSQFCFSGPCQIRQAEDIASHAESVVRHKAMLARPPRLVASMVYDHPQCACLNTIMRLQDYTVHPVHPHDMLLLINRELLPVYMANREPHHRFLYNFLIAYNDLMYNDIDDAKSSSN